MTETTEAVRKSVLVDADPETAFRVFTEQIESWWPLRTHGVFGDDAERLSFEESKLVERAKDGREAVWGEVLAWEPPTRAHFTWRPGFDDDKADTEVEVTFSAEGDGTRVELVHTGWDKLADGAKSRAGYDSGWVGVLEAYRKAIQLALARADRLPAVRSRQQLQPPALVSTRGSRSVMIAAGVNAKALSEFLGHSSVAITLDRYGHLMPGAHGEAADLLDAYLARSVLA